MKTIINKLIYNTDTSEIVASGDNNLYKSDCWFRQEELYITKKGRYFILDSQNNILPVSNKGVISYGQNTTSNIDLWLETWNIGNLQKREEEYFSIKEA